MTRRTFLMLLGQAGGAGAVYGAMTRLGLAAAPERAPLRLTRDEAAGARGKSVLILGAGLAGMCAAYELGKLGYGCRILEARARPGGRCHTVRRGVASEEAGDASQVADFDEGLYLNPGPARLPQQHVTLDYCRELNVPIEVFGNMNDNAFYYNEGVGPLSGRRVRIREAKADLFGYTHELLAKAIRREDLDARLSREDRENLLEFLRTDGGLDKDLAYRMATAGDDAFDRRGYKVDPGAGDQPGVFDAPYGLSALVRSGWGKYFSDEYVYDWQMMMFQPVGGMDRIARAFEREVGHAITYGAAVTEIRQTADGVSAAYTDTGGTRRQASGDLCVCAIPLSVLRAIPADFTPDMARAIAGVRYAPTCKVGLQFRRRFWEEDDRIFGGITHTNQSITQIFYPSTGYLGRKGVLVGCYNFDPDASAMGKLAPQARIAQAVREGAKIHPQYPQELERGFTVAWQNVPYTRGGWAEYTAETRRDLYPVLNRPDGRIYLAGEHMSYLTGWQAGALESARKVVQAVHARAAQGGAAA